MMSKKYFSNVGLKRAFPPPSSFSSSFGMEFMNHIKLLNIPLPISERPTPITFEQTQRQHSGWDLLQGKSMTSSGLWFIFNLDSIGVLLSSFLVTICTVSTSFHKVYNYPFFGKWCPIFCDHWVCIWKFPFLSYNVRRTKFCNLCARGYDILRLRLFIVDSSHVTQSRRQHV